MILLLPKFLNLRLTSNFQPKDEATCSPVLALTWLSKGASLGLRKPLSVVRTHCVHMVWCAMPSSHAQRVSSQMTTDSLWDDVSREIYEIIL